MADSERTFIDTKSTEWTWEETKTTLAVLAKMANCQKNTGRLPRPVFESFAGAKLNVSLEIVCFDANGRGALGQRPTHDKNPDEPYPGLWHSFGVTIGTFEAPPLALQRFFKTEAAPVSVDFVDWIWTWDPPRGPYILLIHIAELKGQPPAGEFFAERDIPWGDLVPSHRKVIIPKALAAWKARKG